MRWYRVYLRDRCNDVRGVQDLVCADDAQALLAAGALRGTWPIAEVHCGNRMVCRLMAPAGPTQRFAGTVGPWDDFRRAGVMRRWMPDDGR